MYVCMKKYAFDDIGEFLDPEITDSELLSHKSHDIRLNKGGVRCKDCDEDLVGNEDVSAIGDPMPIASMLWQLGQNVKDPIMNALRKQFEHEVDGRDWTHMTQEQRREALVDGGISDDYGNGVPSEAVRNYADLTPMTKWKLDNIEAEEYQGLTS